MSCIMSIFRPGVEEQVMIFEIKGLIVYADVNIKWQSKRTSPMIQKAYNSNPIPQWENTQ